MVRNVLTALLLTSADARIGLTETSTVVTATKPDDIFLGSSGSLLPGFECKIVTPENTEITEYDQPGELLVKSPSVVIGYLNNEKANKETFEDGFMRTGDEALVRKSPNGYEHVFIVDRIKELIKVKVCVQRFMQLKSDGCRLNFRANFCSGPPSRTSRTRGASPYTPSSQRLCRDPDS
jgi:hypothetical protein